MSIDMTRPQLQLDGGAGECIASDYVPGSAAQSIWSQCVHFLPPGTLVTQYS